MAGETNFIITLALLEAMVFLCTWKCRTGKSYQSGPARVVSCIGLGIMAFGMALYYTFGIYSFSASAPFLIVGMIIAFLPVCMCGGGSEHVTPVKPAPKVATTRRADSGALDEIAQVARARGMLIEKQDPYDTNLTIRRILCPICRNLFELGSSNIVDHVVTCTSCNYDLDLSP